jgi:hypothetical protein
MVDRRTRASACETAIVARAALDAGARLVVSEPLPLSRAAAFVLDELFTTPHTRHDLEGSIVDAARIARSAGILSDEATLDAERLARDVASTTVADLLDVGSLDVLVDLLFDARLHPSLPLAA